MRCYFHTDVFIGTGSDFGRALQDDIDRWIDMNPYFTASKDVVVGYQIPHATLDDVRRI
jgi:hypothetical protein